jgi:hypothetical protein
MSKQLVKSVTKTVAGPMIVSVPHLTLQQRGNVLKKLLVKIIYKS